MRRKHIQSVLMGLGLAALLTVGVGTWGVANAAPQGQAQSYTGQVREINGRHFSFGVPHHHRFGSLSACPIIAMSSLSASPIIALVSLSASIGTRSLSTPPFRTTTSPRACSGDSGARQSPSQETTGGHSASPWLKGVISQDRHMFHKQ